jgi:hypothetical protein
MQSINGDDSAGRRIIAKAASTGLFNPLQIQLCRFGISVAQDFLIRVSDEATTLGFQGKRALLLFYSSKYKPLAGRATEDIISLAGVHSCASRNVTGSLIDQTHGSDDCRLLSSVDLGQ